MSCKQCIHNVLNVENDKGDYVFYCEVQDERRMDITPCEYFEGDGINDSV